MEQSFGVDYWKEYLPPWKVTIGLSNVFGEAQVQALVNVVFQKMADPLGYLDAMKEAARTAPLGMNQWVNNLLKDDFPAAGVSALQAAAMGAKIEDAAYDAEMMEEVVPFTDPKVGIVEFEKAKKKSKEKPPSEAEIEVLKAAGLWPDDPEAIWKPGPKPVNLLNLVRVLEFMGMIDPRVRMYVTRDVQTKITTYEARATWAVTDETLSRYDEKRVMETVGPLIAAKLPTEYVAARPITAQKAAQDVQAAITAQIKEINRLTLKLKKDLDAFQKATDG